MIIGLGYQKRVGKDTVADYLVKKHGFRRIAFADELKAIAKELGWDGKKDERGRKFLQVLGTDLMRAYNPNVWIDLVKRNIECGPVCYGGAEDDIVITDCRFENEATMIKKLGGYVVKVYRPLPEHNQDQHASETELENFPFDYIIDNLWTKRRLYSEVERMLGMLKERA